jgi:hypothetical protein
MGLELYKQHMSQSIFFKMALIDNLQGPLAHIHKRWPADEIRCVHIVDYSELYSDCTFIPLNIKPSVLVIKSYLDANLSSFWSVYVCQPWYNRALCASSYINHIHIIKWCPWLILHVICIGLVDSEVLQYLLYCRDSGLPLPRRKMSRQVKHQATGQTYPGPSHSSGTGSSSAAATGEFSFLGYRQQHLSSQLRDSFPLNYFTEHWRSDMLVTSVQWQRQGRHLCLLLLLSVRVAHWLWLVYCR